MKKLIRKVFKNTDRWSVANTEKRLGYNYEASK